MNLGKILLVGLISLNIAFADTAAIINKGDAAPFDGIIVTKEKIQELKNNSIERDALERLNLSLSTSLNLQNDIINKQQEKVKLLLEQNDKLAKTSYDSQSVNDWVKVAWFAGGIVVTGLSAYALSQIRR